MKPSINEKNATENAPIHVVGKDEFIEKIVKSEHRHFNFFVVVDGRDVEVSLTCPCFEGDLFNIGYSDFEYDEYFTPYAGSVDMLLTFSIGIYKKTIGEYLEAGIDFYRDR